MNPILLYTAGALLGILVGCILPPVGVLVVLLVLIVIAAWKWIMDYVVQKDTGLFGVPAKIAPMAIVVFAVAMGFTTMFTNDTRITSFLPSL